VRQNENKDNIASKDNLDNNITFRIRYTTSKTFDNKLIIDFKSKRYMINSVINERDENKYFLSWLCNIIVMAKLNVKVEGLKELRSRFQQAPQTVENQVEKDNR